MGHLQQVVQIRTDLQKCGLAADIRASLQILCASLGGQWRSQVHPPTGVTHSAAGVFTAAAAATGARPDLVTARATRLELWRARCLASPMQRASPLFIAARAFGLMQDTDEVRKQVQPLHADI